MKKQFHLCLLMLVCTISAFSQSVSSDYFEVYTKPAHTRPSSGFSFKRDSILARINNISDTASTYATFAISVDAISHVDSLKFTLINSQEQTVYSGGGAIEDLRSNALFKINNNTLYYTVGPFPYLKRFSATAQIRGTDGQLTPIKSFAKN